MHKIPGHFRGVGRSSKVSVCVCVCGGGDWTKSGGGGGGGKLDQNL